MINELEFGKRIKSIEASYRVIEENCDQKAKSIAKFLLNSNNLISNDVESKATFFALNQT